MINLSGSILIRLFIPLVLLIFSSQAQDFSNIGWIKAQLEKSLIDTLDGDINLQLPEEKKSDFMILFPRQSQDAPNIVNDIRISIVYQPIHKWIFFKQGYKRIAYISLNMTSQKRYALKSFVFQDTIGQDYKKLENPNYHWTIGHVSVAGNNMKPAWLEPVIMIGASVVVIASLFFVRS